MSGIAIEDSQTIDEDEAGAIRLGDIYIPPPYKPPDHIRKTLVMVKIVNKNFKSFYGEVTLGPFHERFTSIIGPNGSGKSNVIDALMFVFGSRANKIRSKKLSALIHESALHKNNDSCSVSIHYKQVIRDQEECQDVPNSEIIVSRTIFKDNSGFYKLNNEKVPYKTIFKLFKELGIDLNHNRFLILQGEVEQIALMRSMGRNENEVGMLEYMEDIIGTSRYKTALKNLQNKVEELIVSKSEKISNAEIARQQLEDCRKPRDNAVEFFQIENKIANYKNILLQKQLSISQSAFNKFEEKKRALNSTIAEQRKKIDANEDIKSKLENEIEAFKNKTNFILSRINELDKTFDKLNKDDIEKGEESRSVNVNRKSLMKKLQESKINQDKLMANPTKYSSEIAECEKKLKFLNIQYEKEAEALEQSKKKIGKVSTHLIEAKNSLQLKLKPEKNKLHEINDEYNKLIHKLKVSTNKSNQLQNNAKSKKSRLENAMMQLEERNLLITNLENIIQSSTNQIAKYQSELKDILQQEELNNKEVSENRNILNELKEIDFTRSRSKVLDFLHKKSNEGELDGLFGRLGDLGSIDVKYDIAISTACGALDNILVENITTAQKCIELLKQYNIGRATFIALDKQQHFWDNIKARFESPENLPRLFDLIRVNDTRILPAFYYVTRNTLVASNLDQATRVAYGRNRHRVVTVKGELIELAGTMSGGGNKFRRGIMSNQMLKKSQLYNTSKYNLNDIQRECERLEEIKRDITRRKDNAADQINVLNQTLSRDRLKLNDIKKVIKPILEECQQLKEEIKNSETIEVPDEVSSLQIIVAERKRVLDEQQDVVNKIEEELNEVLEKINSSVIGSIKFEQTKINNLKKEISKFQNQIMTLKVATTNNEKKVAMTKKQISSMELDIEKCQNQILKLQDERKKIEENAQVVMREKEEHEIKLNEIKETYRVTKTKLKSINKARTALNSELLELENQFTEIRQKLNNCSKEIDLYNSEKNQLKLNESSLTSLVDECFKTLTAEELADIHVNEVEKQIHDAETKIKENKLEPNITAINIFNESIARDKDARNAVSLVTSELEKIKELLNTLEERRMDEFMTGFGIIAMKCREFYRMLSLDGDADLDLVDSYNPFTKGVTLNIRPPKKSWRSIMQLSGGEKTLSSLAFVFAIHHFRPSPMYLMDEIDAALDTRNVTIVGNLIQHLSDHTQFIVISLRESMFRLCNRLVGIYKVEDCTGFMVINNINNTQPNSNEHPPSNNRKLLNFQYTREDSNLVEVIMKNQIFIENPIIMPICDESTSNIDNDISSSSSSLPPPSKKTKIQ